MIGEGQQACSLIVVVHLRLPATQCPVNRFVLGRPCSWESGWASTQNLKTVIMGQSTLARRVDFSEGAHDGNDGKPVFGHER